MISFLSLAQVKCSHFFPFKQLNFRSTLHFVMAYAVNLLVKLYFKYN